MIKLRCPICKKRLYKGNKKYTCVNKHSFDISKNGYVNLLLNKPHSGDNKIMINARHLVLEQGYFKNVIDEIIFLVKKYNIHYILDAGCGEGYYSRNIYQALKPKIIGIDISKYGCRKASILNKDISYIVGSIYNLPLQDLSVDGIINIFAPANEQEFARVTRKYLLKVIPDKKHLLELKKLLYEEVRIKKVKLPSYQNFKLIYTKDIEYQKEVNDIYNLIKMTPFYYKSNIKNKSIFPSACNITFAMKILLYQKV